MHKLAATTFCVFLSGFLASEAYAEDQSLGEITVHAEEGEGASPSQPNYDSSAFTSVITSKELKNRKTNLSEVLQDVGGVEVKHLGGLDDFATVSIRGSTVEQVAIYMDGILLNPGVNGTVNVASIPTDQVERIEVYKGTAPARFGTSSIGGVVNIITKKAHKGREIVFSQSYGSFKTYEGSLTHSQTLDRFSYQAGYTYTRSAGDFSFLDNNGTPFNSSDDQVRTRENNEFARHNFLTQFDCLLSPEKKLSLSFNNQFFREDRGIPGLATLSSNIAGLSTTRNGTIIELTKKDLLPNLEVTLAPFFQFLKTQFGDPHGDIGVGTQDTDDMSLAYGTEVRNNFLLGNHQRLGLYIDYRGEQFLPKDFALTPATSSSSVRNSVSASFEDEIFLLGERLILNPSLRTEHIFNEFAGRSASTLHPVSGKVGVKYLPLASGKYLTLKTNLSRSYRVPNFSELFGDRGSFKGNPTLNPESGWNWDVGSILSWNFLRVEVSYFLNQTSDLIQFLQTSQSNVIAENLSKTRNQGTELFVFLSPLEFLDVSGNYTFQWATDVSGLPGVDGKFLPGRPRHAINGKINLHNSWGQVFSDINFIDDNFLDTQNILRVDSRIFLGAGVSAHFLKRFTTSLEAKNLLNHRVSDVVGFPLPGRSYYGKVTITI